MPLCCVVQSLVPWPMPIILGSILLLLLLIKKNYIFLYNWNSTMIINYYNYYKEKLLNKVNSTNISSFISIFIKLWTLNMKNWRGWNCCKLLHGEVKSVKGLKIVHLSGRNCYKLLQGKLKGVKGLKIIHLSGRKLL